MIEITVKNMGTEPWLGGAEAKSVDAGYRWRDAKGNILPIEGTRALLTRSVVGPGEADVLKLKVVAPPQPGLYTLWVSMVQEQVAWFFQEGAKPLAVPVTVT